jgi:PhzF family phenazine biosynthesis protein
MQAVAAEMNHAETAFLLPGDGALGLRWFTPAKEVPLCGHATLAAAHVLWETERLSRQDKALFDTKSGRLSCTLEDDGLVAMDFPTDAPVPCDAPPGLFAALGCQTAPVYEGKALSNFMVVLTDEAAVRAVRPDMAALRALSSTQAFIVTAAAADGDGYVCRYFAPAWGIDEDPATGSIQTTLGPYWADRLGRPSVRCRQLSTRGATMQVRPAGPRTAIAGHAVTTLRGTLAAGPTG